MLKKEFKLPGAPQPGIVAADKTVIKALALGGLERGGAPCAVDVKDGKIVRVRPLHFETQYPKKDFNPWKFVRNGQTLEAPLKSLPAPFSLAYKKRTYSPNRIQFPLKRVDWEPNGERHPENRGKSRYVRISWKEAADLVAAEIRRVQAKYGPYAILVQGDGHGECKIIHTPHGQSTLLLDKMGGFTQQARNPDSWEGWYWGSKHVWGNGLTGILGPQDNIIYDMTMHSEQVLFWGADPETTCWGFHGQFGSLLSYFWTQIGIRQVYICPDLNYSAALHADKWIPVLPNTDAALQLAIIYMWIKEDTYDKEYVRTHTVGFDKVKAYVMGEEDGIPKTPAWAAPKCGVPEWTIKALAREFASKVTSIAHVYGGPMVRGPFSHEPARLECILLGMQGLGKPGVHQSQFGDKGMPRSEGLRARFSTDELAPARIRRPFQTTNTAWQKQLIPKTLLHKAIPNPPITFWGNGTLYASTEDQFVKYTYPIPKEEGGTEIHMIWTDTPCRTTCWNSGNETIEAMRNSKIECIIAQHPWLENDCLLADIILPANTTMEVEDIVINSREGAPLKCIALQEKAIEPIGESLSDYEIVCEIARPLGLLEEVTEGKTLQDLEKLIYQHLEVENFMSWEDFKKKGYFVFPIAEGWEKDVPGIRNFYENPQKYPLETPSGKLEFYSERLAKYFPQDTERPPIPKWIEKSELHDERLTSERAIRYPLLAMSNHGRWRVHSQCDDISWTHEAVTGKVTGWDGYLYEPLWMNPQDAEKRGIRGGDIVKVFNERGVVLCGALVWERMMPGAISVDHGARMDNIIPGKLDRGGAIDLITPDKITSKNCVGMACSGFLVEVEKVTPAEMAGWQRDYPEAFQRKYDASSGLDFQGWVIDS